MSRRSHGGRGRADSLRTIALRTLPIFAEAPAAAALRPPRTSTDSHHFHHDGHFDADVFRHHGPRLPLLHHLHAVRTRRMRKEEDEEGSATRAAGKHGRTRDVALLPHPWRPDNGRAARAVTVSHRCPQVAREG